MRFSVCACVHVCGSALQELYRELDPFDGDGLHCQGTGMVCRATLAALVRLLELGPRPAAAASEA